MQFAARLQVATVCAALGLFACKGVAAEVAGPGALPAKVESQGYIDSQSNEALPGRDSYVTQDASPMGPLGKEGLGVPTSAPIGPGKTPVVASPRKVLVQAPPARYPIIIGIQY